MELLFPYILLAYSLCWYGTFHLINTPPTESSSDLGVTKPTHCINAHDNVAGEVKKVKTVKQQSFDNEGLHRKARLTKSGSFPAASSSSMRRKGRITLDHKQREIWPPSQSAISNDISLEKLMPMVRKDSKGRFNPRIFRRGLSLSVLEYNSFLPNMDAFREAASRDNDSAASSLEYRDEMIMSEGSESVVQSQRAYNHGKTKSVEIIDQLSPLEMEDDDEYSLCVNHILDSYSLKQPLNSDLFEEIETHYRDLHLLKSSIKEDERKQDSKLIYDLINEALAFINERQYLKALSFKSHLHPVHKDQHLLDKIPGFVGRSLNWIPNLDNLLESSIDESNWIGGWMNLQTESECTALELEDLILDELLDEILFC